MDGAARDIWIERRIAAMLVAMAAVAERAGGRSFAVRWLVLLILGRAEAVAWVLVVEVTRAAWPRFEKPFEGGSSASDAARLATRLRALGLALGLALGQLGLRA